MRSWYDFQAECENNEDEEGCESSLVLLSILGTLFLSIVTVLLALCLQSGSDDDQWKGNDKMHDFNGICQDIYYFITQQAISSQSSLSDVFVNFIEHIYKDDDENKTKFLQQLLNQGYFFSFIIINCYFDCKQIIIK